MNPLVRSCLPSVLLAVVSTASIAPLRCGAESVAAPSPAFRADAIRQLRAARQQRLRQAIVAFDAGLKAEFDAGAYADWSAYLGWDVWARPIVERDEYPIAAMKRIAKRFYSANEGFDHPLIGEVRTALVELVDLEEGVELSKGDLVSQFLESTAVVRYALDSDDADYAELESAVWWLDATGQAPELLAGIERKYDGPVIVGQIRRDLIENKLLNFGGETHETRDVRRRIQGAMVRGTSTIDSRAVVELADGATDARLRVTLRGQVRAHRNSSSVQRVRVTSSSTSAFEATADVYWNGEKFVTTTPTATVDTRSSIRSIDAPLLMRRPATRRVYGSKASAEAEVESLIEAEVVKALSDRLARAAERFNERSARFLGFLKATDNDAKPWTTHLRDNEIVVGYLPRSRTRLAAKPITPPLLAGEEVIGLSFHDGAISGIFTAQLAGCVWRDENFAHMQRELTGGNSEELLIGLDPQRWSVQWSWRAPVRVLFRPEAAELRYRFDRVTIDGVDYEAPIEVRTEYSAVSTSLGHRVQRLGLPTVTNLDPDRPLAQEAADFLVKKFTRPTAETYRLDGLQFPAGGELDGLSGFRPVSATLAPHWVHLHYIRPAVRSYPQATDVAGAQ